MATDPASLLAGSMGAANGGTASPPPGSHLLAVEEETSHFRWLRSRLFVNQMTQFARHNRLRTLLVAGCTAVLWLLLYGVSRAGFVFLGNAVPYEEIRIQTEWAIFGMFMASLMMMLMFSAGILLYSGLYRNKESAFLMSLPVRGERIFLHKLQEALFFSSWGFLLLGSPLFVAYGEIYQAPWYFYVLIYPMMLAFVCIPGCVAAMLCLLLMDWLPTLRKQVLLLTGLILFAGLAYLGWTTFGTAKSGLLTPDWFRDLLGRLQFSQQYALPSWWLTMGAIVAARGNWQEALLFFAVLATNAGLCLQLAVWMAKRAYRRSYNRLASVSDGRRQARGWWVDGWLTSRVSPLPTRVALLFVKDFRVLRRDPLQWSQFIIFFGLLSLYFVNLPRYRQGIQQSLWVNIISMLNVAVIGLLLGTFTTRFIYPLVSLEGRSFWMLGLLPMRRETLLWSKFVFSVASSLFGCVALVAISDLILGAGLIIGCTHAYVIIWLCLGLAAITVGMGAALPNLRETSPSKIAAGHGGTLNLVLSTSYIITILALAVAPMHLWVMQQEMGEDLSMTTIASWIMKIRQSGFGQHLQKLPIDLLNLGNLALLGLASGTLLGLATCTYFLRAGFRAIRKWET